MPPRSLIRRQTGYLFIKSKISYLYLQIHTTYYKHIQNILHIYIRFSLLHVSAIDRYHQEVTYDVYHHHHHISVMELGHLLTRSGLTYPEVSTKICHDSFCQLGNSVSLPWVIYYEAFYSQVCIQFLLYSSSLSKICVFFNSFAICVFVL